MRRGQYQRISGACKVMPASNWFNDNFERATKAEKSVGTTGPIGHIQWASCYGRLEDCRMRVQLGYVPRDDSRAFSRPAILIEASGPRLLCGDCARVWLKEAYGRGLRTYVSFHLFGLGLTHKSTRASVGESQFGEWGNGVEGGIF